MIVTYNVRIKLFFPNTYVGNSSSSATQSLQVATYVCDIVEDIVDCKSRLFKEAHGLAAMVGSSDWAQAKEI